MGPGQVDHFLLQILSKLKCCKDIDNCVHLFFKNDKIKKDSDEVMIALKALPRHPLNFSDILKPILPQFLLLPQMCVGSTFLLSFSRNTHVYIFCAYGLVLIFTLFTHLISSPSTAVHWPTPSPPSPLPQELRLINGVQDVCRIQVWVGNFNDNRVSSNNIELDQCLWKLFTNIDEKPINNNQKLLSKVIQELFHILFCLSFYTFRQDYTAFYCAPSACLLAL